ncbi:MAG: FAD-dependent oxidoreductase [Chloroflexota bacterium]
MLSLRINGQETKAKENESILQAANRAGVYIPALCAHPDLEPAGTCNLCLVEVEGISDLAKACVTKAARDMVVHTDSARIREARLAALKKLFAEHPHACLVCERRVRCKPFDICLRNVQVTERCITCPKNTRCELQKVADYVGLVSEAVPDYKYRGLPMERDNPFFDRDYNLCISCGRCIAACRKLRGIEALDWVQKDGYRLAGPVKGTLKESGCKFCFTCVEVCPTGALVDNEARYTGIADREAYVVPCRNACPAHIDIPRYVQYIALGRPSAALAVIRETVPFPGSLGRVCIHPCEQACRREDLNQNQPVCIKFLKRFADDHDTGAWREHSRKKPATGKKVAVVGAGPAGLTAAYYLAKQGHVVTVFEALPEPGGMMRVGIPAYRLPRDVLSREIDEIKGVGVEIKTNTRIDSLDELFQQGYSAVFLGLGAHGPMKMGVEGEDSPGVLEGVTFLRKVNLGEKVSVGDKVAVIGGGNVAIDCARVSLRAGSKDVTIVYRRTRAEMPAAAEEVEEALHEGIKVVYLTAPSKVSTRDGKVLLECLRMKLGEPDASGRRRPVPIKGSEYTEEYDSVLAAIGQTPQVPEKYGVKVARNGTVQADGSLATSRKGVFAGGDVQIGPASVIAAIDAGRKAAVAIDKYLGGKGDIQEVLVEPEEFSAVFGREDGFAFKGTPKMPMIPNEERLGGFEEVETGYPVDVAIAEAKRCLRCDARLKLSPVPLPPERVTEEAYSEVC